MFVNFREGIHRLPELRLVNGQQLRNVEAAYVTLGQLNAKKDNAILLAHGYTSSHRFVLPGSEAAEGSWSELVGPGAAIDTSRYFVISSNCLGSCYGSTGPASLKADGAPYGPDFPEIDFADAVLLQKSLVDSFGIERLYAIGGVSMGGFQALQWAVQYPEASRRIFVVLSDLTGRRVAGTGLKTLRARLAGTPGWNDGHYRPGAMRERLTELRIDTLNNYGLDEWLKSNGLSDEDRATQIRRLAQDWAGGFDANALITLMKAIERFDARSELHRITARILYVLATSDTLFPASMGEAVVQAFQSVNVGIDFHRIETNFGHLASGVDAKAWSQVLSTWIDTPSSADRETTVT